MEESKEIKKIFRKLIKKHLNILKKCYKESKVSFVKHFFKLIWMTIVYPYRKLIEKIENTEFKYRTKGKKEIKKFIQGYQMILPVDDTGLSRALILKGKREENVHNILNKELNTDSVVIDVGSNIGCYVMLEAARVLKGNGKVYAIEPNSLAYKYLLKNIELNGYSKDLVKTMNIGIGNKKCKLPFYMSERWNWSRFTKKSSRDKILGREKILEVKNIQMDKLDNIFKNEKVNFIRMDVEGYEFEVLKGAKELIKRSDKLEIFFEFHVKYFDKEKREELIKFLKENKLKIIYFFSKSKRKPKEIKKYSFEPIRKAMYYKTYQIFLRKKQN